MSLAQQWIWEEDYMCVVLRTELLSSHIQGSTHSQSWKLSNWTKNPKWSLSVHWTFPHVPSTTHLLWLSLVIWAVIPHLEVFWMELLNWRVVACSHWVSYESTQGSGSRHNVMIRFCSSSGLSNVKGYVLGFSQWSLPKALTFFKLQHKKLRFQPRAPGQKTDQCHSDYCFMVGPWKDFKHENHSFKPNR